MLVRRHIYIIYAHYENSKTADFEVLREWARRWIIWMMHWWNHHGCIHDRLLGRTAFKCVNYNAVFYGKVNFSKILIINTTSLDHDGDISSVGFFVSQKSTGLYNIEYQSKTHVNLTTCKILVVQNICFCQVMDKKVFMRFEFRMCSGQTGILYCTYPSSKFHHSQWWLCAIQYHRNLHGFICHVNHFVVLLKLVHDKMFQLV